MEVGARAEVDDDEGRAADDAEQECALNCFFEDTKPHVGHDTWVAVCCSNECFELYVGFVGHRSHTKVWGSPGAPLTLFEEEAEESAVDVSGGGGGGGGGGG